MPFKAYTTVYSIYLEQYVGGVLLKLRGMCEMRTKFKSWRNERYVQRKHASLWMMLLWLEIVCNDAYYCSCFFIVTHFIFIANIFWVEIQNQQDHFEVKFCRMKFGDLYCTTLYHSNMRVADISWNRPSNKIKYGYDNKNSFQHLQNHLSPFLEYGGLLLEHSGGWDYLLS